MEKIRKKNILVVFFRAEGGVEEKMFNGMAVKRCEGA